jgi:hypothetical protein
VSSIGNRIDGELRTDDFTIVAIDAAVGVQNLGGMISLIVIARGEGQDIAGAKFNAITTALASLFEDVNDAPGDIDNPCIQRYAPEIHGCLSFCTEVFTG